MINLTGLILFRISGESLFLTANLCLQKVISLLPEIRFSRQMERSSKVFEETFCRGIASADDLETTLLYWFEVSSRLRNRGTLLLSRLLPGVEFNRTLMEDRDFRPFIKLFFILMYKEKALLLPYEFERPYISWLGQVERKFEIWPELISVFRKLGEPHRNQDRGTIRVIQTSSKILLTTDWYNVEDVNQSELDELYAAYTQGRGGLQTPIPFDSILEVAGNKFPQRFPPSLWQWIDKNKTLSSDVGTNFTSRGLNRGVLNKYAKHELFRIVTHSEDLTGELKSFFENYAIPNSLFSASGIESSGVCDILNSALGVDLLKTLNAWVVSQKWFLDDKVLEDDKSYRTAFGRLNLWLFVYLPTWRFRNPDLSYPFPSTPADFISKNYIDDSSDDARPFTLVEFYEALGWAVNRTNMNSYSLYFSELAFSGLDECDVGRNPISILPHEVSRDKVAKNITDVEDDRLFTSLLESIDSLSDLLCGVEDLHGLVMQCIVNNNWLDFDVIGCRPEIVAAGQVIPVRYLPPQIFHFTVIGNKYYYNPGVIRFCLFIRGAGPRGQNAQWLDADTYDKAASRTSNHPRGIDMLYINTDKIRTHPYVVYTLVSNIRLLDRQREWRNKMINEHGASVFTRKVYYAGRKKSKWGKILPLFAYCGNTGAPFGDGIYSSCWTYLYLGFQWATREYRKGKAPLVSLIPVLKDKKIAKWEAWHAGSIGAHLIKVVNEDGGVSGTAAPYCALSLRCFSTPHGGRSAFASEMGDILSPEHAALMTGQTPLQFTRYNQSQSLFSELERALNNKEIDAIQSLSSQAPNMYKFAEAFEVHSTTGTSTDLLEKNGFLAGHNPEFILSIDSILKTPGFLFGVCATHICILKFNCSKRVIDTVGYKNCAECPYAIFSPANIIAITAAVRKAFDEFSKFERYVKSKVEACSDYERENFSRELSRLARYVVAWYKIQIGLWSVIKVNKGEGLLVGDEREFYKTVTQYQVEKDSKEDFLESIVHATAYKELVSEDMNLRIERATRLLMAGNGALHEAVTRPSSLTPVEMLASEIRFCMQKHKIDFDRLVQLLNASEEQWRDILISRAPSDNSVEALSLGVIIVKAR